jgi:hypothetical protein
MPDFSAHTRSILKNDPDFEGLDFAALRAEGINYVAELSGRIWTDHNVHDPGITLLELLCYALIDLGYRTRLPAADLFSQDPSSPGEEDNFFTPAQILTCNPVTISDFRKLLMDIKEVKNAWLEVSDEWLECTQTAVPGTTDTATPLAAQARCKNSLNGLYKVYLELYKGPHKPEASWSKKEKEYVNAVVERVREVLMAHRNLCEDFVSITVLCKEKIGVCADIELEAAADAEKTYVKVIETLKGFFSPDPKYYTLSQMLERGKAIDEVFAGRPFLPESHGFIDTEELEGITLRKEIHISDVYNALFSIPGIRTVKKLTLRNCETGAASETKWEYNLAPNHTPEFSLDCSGFRFTRNDMPVSVNEKKYKDYFALNYSLSGKILHTKQLPALDLAVPRGIYHSDLEVHDSIVNELPLVYGVSEGGIPDTASSQRKAQALQLKGFLLFFDQLLANYLAQLGSLRELFSMKNQQKGSTYFTALPQQVPDFDKLLRFGNAGGGEIHAVPVEKSTIDDLLSQDELKKADIENDFQRVEFVTAADRDAAMYTLMEDLQNRSHTIYTVQTDNGCWFFYIFTTSDRVALLSKTYYSDEKSARLAAENVSYIGAFNENYRRYTKSNSTLSSFDIELGMAGYSVYLQQMAEDGQLYMERRKAFLDHLLARFSESFTDFALLSFDTLQEDKLAQRDLDRKAAFLSSYDKLGRNRGKGYDYRVNGWGNNNVSGFEQRVKALAGMEDCCGQSLCHFEVFEYTGQHYWVIASGGQTLFKSSSLFDSPAEAATDLDAFITALKDEASYKVNPVPLHETHALTVEYRGDLVAYPQHHGQPGDANVVGAHLRQLLRGEPAEGDILVSSQVYRPLLLNERKEVVRTSKQAFDTQQKAISAAKGLLRKINDDDWESAATDEGVKVKLDLKWLKADPFKLVDAAPFTVSLSPWPDEYRWHLNNDTGDRVLVSANTYPSPLAAFEGMLNELTEQEFTSENFKTHDDKDAFRFGLLKQDGSVLASSPVVSDEAVRTGAMQFVEAFCRRERSEEQYTYLIAEACHWQVEFGPGLVFRSTALLADPENAMNTWRKDKRSFRVPENLSWSWDEKGELNLLVKDGTGSVIARLLPDTSRTDLPEDIAAAIQASLAEKKFRVTTVKVEQGFGFRMYDDGGQVLLSGYEVYQSRGAAFAKVLEALQGAGREDMYLKSGDEGNREFTFFLKSGGSQFLAEHPVLYDNEKDRDDMLQHALTFLSAKKAPGGTEKEPLSHTFSLSSGDNLMLTSVQKFKTPREATENAGLTLLVAGNPDNYRYHQNPAGEHIVQLVSGGQVLAVAPGSFADPLVAEGIRNQITGYVRPHLYEVEIRAFDDKWRFRISIGIDKARAQFLSREEYGRVDEAIAAYKKMAADMGNLKLQKAEGKTELVSKQKINKTNIAATLQPDPAQEKEQEETAQKALAVSQLFHQLSTAEDKKALQRMVRKDDLAGQGTWVYRLVKSHGYFAYHLDCGKEQVNDDRKIKNLHAAATDKPAFLQICLGGDITCKRKDAAGNPRYHYLLKWRNYTPGEKELELFISAKGYETQSDAEAAFEKEYLTVLKRASKAYHYGEGKYISLAETFTAATAGCVRNENPVVCVTAEAMAHFSSEAAAVGALVELAKSYPVRISGKRFKFSLYDYKKKASYFISAATYATPADALKAFFFLLVLVRNRKNYYMHCDEDTGNKFIVLKEVLLESTRRFPSREAAWGSNGIEKLIGISQTEEAFHISLNRDDCCFSFFVSCKSKIVHPCTYDTVAARDAALSRLFKGFADYKAPGLPDVALDANGAYYNVTWRGKLVAALPREQDNRQGGPCTPAFLSFVETILKLENCKATTVGEHLVLKDEDDKEIARVDGTQFTAEEWINTLVDMAVQFPIFKKDGVYYFRIPFPGSSVSTDSSTSDPCGCDQPVIPDSPDCYLAWLGGCYSTCGQALEALKALPEKLRNEKNYRSVFDCSCGSYRIEFIEDDEIVAASPQCYATREMVCEAVERANMLMNCEGMHLVEHILLRPRTGCTGHCSCLIPDCPDYSCNDFVWKEYGDEDPCKPAGSDPCFIPGKDPYSCIATVMLPAWTKRFRKQKNRDLVTRMLHREAPAHVLLRVLWLSPKDLCTLEASYKSWLRWLATKKNNCGSPFDLCQFINLLFRTRLDCWWPADYCPPCRPEDAVQNACAELNSQETRGYCNTTVNDVFCWTTPDCCYEYKRINLKPEDEAEKMKLIRKRTAQYTERLEQLQAALPEDAVIGQAISYIRGGSPDEEKLLRITKLLKEEGEKKEEGVTAAQKKAYGEAMDTVLNFYLDRSLLDQYDPNKLSDIKRTMRKVNLKKQQVPQVLKGWDTGELSGFVHNSAFEALRGIFKK